MFSNYHPANVEMTYVANNYEFVFVIKSILILSFNEIYTVRYLHLMFEDFPYLLLSRRALIANF